MIKDLTTEQKSILFKEDTELPGSSPLNYEKREGTYLCVGCGTKLFESKKKYESGSGWPSFFETLPNVFEIKIACTSLFIMSISDSLSAIVGKRFGAITIYKKKTLEGSLAFLLSSLIIIFIVPELNLFHAIVAALVATIIELYSVDVIDDNLSIPISFCVVMTLLRGY